MGKLKAELLRGDRKVGVWGTGYIGFSTLANFAANGVKCLGTDTNPDTVQAVNEGRVPVANLEYWLGFDPKPLVDAGMIRATTGWKELLNDEIAVHMIAIPTEKGDKPWDGALRDVTEKIAKVEIKHSSSPLMIIESTLTPKKTDELVIPILESAGLRVGRDIHVGVAPRRDWFISPEKNLKNLPRVLGGTTPETTKLMIDVLSIVCDRLLPAPDHRHAEMVKSIENAYRHVEITLANQLSLAYPDIDMTEVLRLVGTKWNIGTYHPSFGTGGYCLARDEYVIAAREGGIRFLPIGMLYDAVRCTREGEVKVLSYLPNERRSCFRRVTAMSRRRASTVTLRTVGGNELTVTRNHIMFVRKKRRMWKRLARQLKVGDEIPFVDSLPYFKPSIEYPPYLKKGRGGKGHVVDLEYFAGGAEPKRRLGSGVQRLSTGHGRSHQTVPRFLRVDSRLAFLLGLYAAEGCVTRDRRSLRTYLSLNKSETELIDEAKQTLDSYGVTYNEYDDKSAQTHQIRVSSEIWGNFIRETTGGRSAHAQLPEFLIFWHDPEVRRALLGGVLNGDGSFSQGNGTVEFYTKSNVMQQQVIYLLRSIGLSPTLKRQRDHPLIRLSGRTAREFAKSVFVGAKLTKVHRYLESSKNRDPRRAHEETQRPTLKQIGPNGDDFVYSLEVENTRNFFTTSGWLVHNCIPLSSQYLLSGTGHPERLSILKAAVDADRELPLMVADALASRGSKKVGILGLSYKGDLKVHILSPTLKIVRRLKEKGVEVKVHDPYYSENEIRQIVGAESFSFPEGMKEFDAVVVVAGHRAYRSVPEATILKNLENCRLVLDNVEEAWRRIEFSASKIEYHTAGDRDWLSSTRKSSG
jgi:UDP-N-acetyl-D-mannosaminuronate dehydrogenase